MAVQEYELVQLKKSDFQDNFGNWWVDAAFRGVGEPVKWVLKDPTKVTEGETYRGEIKEVTSKAGKTYLRFYRENIQEQQPTPATKPAQVASKPDEAYWQSKNDHIKAQWAIGQAVQLAHTRGTQTNFEDGSKDGLSLTYIERIATKLFAMVDRVAGSTSVVEEQSGYKKAKEVAEELEAKKLAKSLDNGEPLPEDTTDYSTIDTDVPINMDDIPF